MKHIRNYIRSQIHLRQARRWLDNEGLRAAAYAMFLLNRHARNIEGPYHIYDLKNLFIEHLYSLQPHSIEVHIQKLDCWNCNGSGQFRYGPRLTDYDICYKCSGTGVHRTHRLYAFNFRAGNRTYQWHQPQSLVTWPVEIAEGFRPYKAQSGPFFRSLPSSTTDLLLLAVYEYLRREGVDLERVYNPVPTLRQTIQSQRREFKMWRYWTRIRWSRRRRELVQAFRTRIGLGTADDDFDNIPF